MEKQRLPEWFVNSMKTALLGEIYPNIRAIAASYDEESKTVKLLYYLDREPTEFDRESIEVVFTNLDATVPVSIAEVDLNCVYSEALQRDFDPLMEFVYARREYDNL